MTESERSEALPTTVDKENFLPLNTLISEEAKAKGKSKITGERHGNSRDPGGQGHASRLHIKGSREAQKNMHRLQNLEGMPSGWLKGKFKKRHEKYKTRIRD